MISTIFQRPSMITHLKNKWNNKKLSVKIFFNLQTPFKGEIFFYEILPLYKNDPFTKI